jgi:hypothetical protein
VIILRCGTIGCPGVGLGGAVGVAGAAAWGGAAGVGALGWAGGGGATAIGGGVTTTAGGATGFSAGGGGGITTAVAGLATGGVTTTLFSAAGAAGLGATTAAGFSAAGAGGATGACGLATGGAAGLAATGGATGRAGGAGSCFCCSRSRSNLATSPGFDTLEKSIFGLGSPALLSLPPEPDLAVKCVRTRSASSSSIELEWVFFSLTPTSGKISRIALAFTSSSLARSLIRIFIRSRFPPRFLLPDHNDLTLVVVQFEKLRHYQYQRLASRPAGTRAFRQTSSRTGVPGPRRFCAGWGGKR